MFKTFLAHKAANTTKRILSDEYMPTCMADCDNLWDSEIESSTQTLQKGQTYCFGLEQTIDDQYGRRAGTGFAILNGDDIDITTYDYNCNQKNSVKNIYAATTPSYEGRLFKLKSNKDQTVYFVDIPVTSYAASITLNGITIKENAKFYLSLDNNVPHKITSSYTIYENGNKEETVSYILALDPNYFKIAAQDGYKSTAMFGSNTDGINTNGYEIAKVINSTGGFIAAVPSEMVHSSTVPYAGTYTAESTITIKHYTAGLPGKFIELTANSIFSKNPQSSGESNSNSSEEKSDSNTGLIVGVVVAVVVVVAIVAFCVYWFACRTTSDDKEETPKV